MISRSFTTVTSKEGVEKINPTLAQMILDAGFDGGYMGMVKNGIVTTYTYDGDPALFITAQVTPPHMTISCNNPQDEVVQPIVRMLYDAVGVGEIKTLDL